MVTEYAIVGGMKQAAHHLTSGSQNLTVTKTGLGDILKREFCMQL